MNTSEKQEIICQKIDDWKIFEKNNPATAFNILYIQKRKYFQLIFQ